MRNLRHCILLTMLVALLTACSSTPDGILSKHKMARLLADIHEGEGVVDSERTTFATDSMRLLLQESIYRKHGVTREQVDSSMAWYGRHIEKYMEVYDEVIEILDKRLAQANTMSTQVVENPNRQVSLEGDSVDVWTLPRHRRFYTLGASDFISYRITKDPKWEPGDTYTLNFKALNPKRAIGVVIVTEYTDDTRDVVARSANTPGWSHISLTQNPEKTAANVLVSINYSPEQGETMYVDSISLVRQHRKITRAGVHAGQSATEDTDNALPLPDSIH